MKSAFPRVTIGIPTYNRVDLLGRALDSALAQDYANLEVVISDNASADGTDELCRRVAAGDPRVAYHRHAKNEGPTRNFRNVLARASGSYFMWLADDDWLDPNYVSACMAVHAAHPGTALASGRGLIHNRPDGFEAEWGVGATAASPLARMVRYLAFVRDNSAFFGIARRDQWIRAPIHDCLASDWLMVMNLAFLGEIRVTDAAAIHRSPGGTGATVERIVRTFGYPRIVERAPYTFVGYYAAREILENDGVYGGVPRAERVFMASVAASVIAAAQGAAWPAVGRLYRAAPAVIGEERFGRLRSFVRRALDPGRDDRG